MHTEKAQWIDRSMFESIFQQRKTDGIRGIGNHRQTTTRYGSGNQRILACIRQMFDK